MFPKPIPSPRNPCHAVTLTEYSGIDNTRSANTPVRNKELRLCSPQGKYTIVSRATSPYMDLPLSSNVTVSSLKVNCIQDAEEGTWWRHKPEGRGLDSRWFHWKFGLT